MFLADKADLPGGPYHGLLLLLSPDDVADYPKGLSLGHLLLLSLEDKAACPKVLYLGHLLHLVDEVDHHECCKKQEESHLPTSCCKLKPAAPTWRGAVWSPYSVVPLNVQLYANSTTIRTMDNTYKCTM